ncbi:MAG TPA: pyridoxal 5'-phosphate synthase glutaminase subunit PdxT [Thermoplasmata archaeon]|nr:pyridoxal 5'-phosphate synthase glutaminase subunit PdxT [Thermoplasmata archaeon]
MKVGVLALQGDVPEHLRSARHLLPKGSVVALRRPEQLDELDALFLPGGESTTIARLLYGAHLWTPLAQRLRQGFPVLGTCAGLILLAKEIAPSPSGQDPPSFEVLDVRVRRNDYGPQRESFEAPIVIDGVAGPPFPGVFIRSPRILSVGPQALPVAWRGEEIVGVRSGNIWGLAFHPELSDDPRVHRRFLEESGLLP